MHSYLVSYALLLKAQEKSLPTVNIAQQSDGRPYFPNKSARGRGRRNFQPPSRSSMACQICGYNNHIAIDFRRHFDQHFGSRPTNNQRGSFSRNNNRSFSNFPQAHHSILGPPPSSSSSSVWYPDTGASLYLTPDLSALTIAYDYKGKNKVIVGDGNGLSISHIGKSTLHTPHIYFHLTDVLHVPTITK